MGLHPALYSRRLALVPFLITVGLLVTAESLGDGMMFLPSGSMETAEVDAQRAVLWRTADSTMLTIEPIFRWTQGEGAWVVPFPALPTVSVGDSSFLSELDEVTVPLFVGICYEPHCCCSGPCDVGAPGQGGDPQSVEGDVTVWESGTVGVLDYVILSADEGEGLMAWLDTNGFTLPPSMEDLVSGMDIAGTFFFVARVQPDVQPGRSLAPVTFGFAPDIEPFYPVRLTLAGLPADGHLDVILWVISHSAEVSFLPADLPWSTATEVYPSSCEDWWWPHDDVYSYHAALESWFESSPSGGFVVEYAGLLANEPWVKGGYLPIGEYGWSSLGFPKHVAESAGMETLLQLGVKVTRLRGRLFSSDEDTDMHLEPVPLVQETAVYCYDDGPCYSCPPCPDTGIGPEPTSEGALKPETWSLEISPELKFADWGPASDTPATPDANGQVQGGGGTCATGGPAPRTPWPPMMGFLAGLIFLVVRRLRADGR